MNAADKSQVSKADKRSKVLEGIRQTALKDVLSTKNGREVLWWILEEAGVFNSVWSNSAAIHYNAGKQDFGHWLMGMITDVSDEALFEMMREAKKWKEGDDNG